jgi:hypothetical protein
MSIDDLRNMTEAQLNALTKAQLIDHILQERTSIKVLEDKGDARGPTKQSHQVLDYKGNVIETHTVVWTYGKDGCVDEIKRTIADSKGVVTALPVIKHVSTSMVEAKAELEL